MSRSMRNGRSRRLKSEINVVPYIDVMLVLLVIFMVVAPLTTPGVVDLPTAEKSSRPPTQYIQILLRPDEKSKIGIKQQKGGGDYTETVANRVELMHKLRALHDQNPNYPVLIAADKASRYEDVIRVISDAKKMGISRVGLATQ